VARKWELAIGPLLQRLGLTRPDERPMELDDTARLHARIADLGWSARHPGQRVYGVNVIVPGVVGQSAACYFGPGSSGIYVLGWNPAGGYYFGTENQGGAFPALAAGGSTITASFRGDNREPLPSTAIAAGTAVAVANVWHRTGATNALMWLPAPGFWLEGTRLGFANFTTGAALDLDVYFAAPLEGMRR
jgi:hypothetical protein